MSKPQTAIPEYGNHAPIGRGALAQALLVARTSEGDAPQMEAKAAIAQAAILSARVRYLEQAMFLQVAAPLQVQTQIPGMAFFSSASLTRPQPLGVKGAAGIKG